MISHFSQQIKLIRTGLFSFLLTNFFFREPYPHELRCTIHDIDHTSIFDSLHVDCRVCISIYIYLYIYLYFFYSFIFFPRATRDILILFRLHGKIYDLCIRCCWYCDDYPREKSSFLKFPEWKGISFFTISLFLLRKKWRYRCTGTS